jgi:hypothetical protein
MSDEKRVAKDETDETGRNDMTDDTEGQGGRFPQPDPAYRGGREPGEAAPDDDTEGHRYSGYQPAPAIPGQPKPGEAAADDDTEGHAKRI